VEASTPAEIARRVALDSLHVLGIVDLGDPDADEAADSLGPTLRITPRGRSYLALADGNGAGEPSRFLDNQALRIGSQSRVGHVMGIAPFVEIGRASGYLDVAITQQTLSMALSAGFESDVIRMRLELVATLPDPIARMLVQASAVLGRAEFVQTQGFLWVEDPEVREMLRTRRQTADLFVDPSPPSGLLIAPGVEVDRLARRCRALGVELLLQGEVYRTRSAAPPGRGSGARKVDSTANLPAAAVDPRRASGTRRARRSSATIPAIKRGSGTGSGS
jgi:hypothetical protein